MQSDLEARGPFARDGHVTRVGERVSSHVFQEGGGARAQGARGTPVGAHSWLTSVASTERSYGARGKFSVI